MPPQKIAPVLQRPAEVRQEVVEAIDHEPFRNEVFGRRGLPLRLQKRQLPAHVMNTGDQFIDLPAVQLLRHFIEKINDDLVKNLEATVPRPAATHEMRVKGAAGGNQAENMREQAAGLVGLDAKRARLGRGKLDQRVERNQIKNQLSPDSQPLLVPTLPGENRPARRVLEDGAQFFPGLGLGTMRRENRRDQNGGSDADENAGGPRHADEKDLVRRVDGIRRDNARGVPGQHGGIGAKIGEDVGSDRAAPDEESQGKNE
jgi:hypothetical protein